MESSTHPTPDVPDKLSFIADKFIGGAPEVILRVTHDFAKQEDFLLDRQTGVDPLIVCQHQDLSVDLSLPFPNSSDLVVTSGQFIFSFTQVLLQFSNFRKTALSVDVSLLLDSGQITLAPPDEPVEGTGLESGALTDFAFPIPLVPFTRLLVIVVFELIGATSACALAYILPPLCFVNLTKRRTWETWASYVCICFGGCGKLGNSRLRFAREGSSKARYRLSLGFAERAHSRFWKACCIRSR